MELMDLTICSVRYLKQGKSLKPIQEIHKNYLREQISHYGIDVEFFRSEANWFKTSGMQTPPVLNYIYGDSPNAQYYKVADMVIYIEIFNDDVMMSKFGFQTNSEATVHILMDDFTHAFRRLIGYEYTECVNIPVYTPVSRYNGNLSGCTLINNIQYLKFEKQLNYNDFNYYCNNQVYPKSSIEICSTTCDNMTYIANTLKTQYLQDSLSYDNSDQLKCYNISGNLNIPTEIKRYGSGVICGNLTGIITYFKEYNPDGIIFKPMPGDFFRLSFDSYNHLEYEITQVINQNLTAGGMNPLMARYSWQCTVIRRTPSFETLVGETHQSEEKLEIPQKERLNNTVEIVSNTIHDYSCRNNYTTDVDSVNCDKSYGGNGKIVFGDPKLANDVDDFKPDDILHPCSLKHIINIYNQ